MQPGLQLLQTLTIFRRSQETGDAAVLPGHPAQWAQRPGWPQADASVSVPSGGPSLNSRKGDSKGKGELQRSDILATGKMLRPRDGPPRRRIGRDGREAEAGRASSCPPVSAWLRYRNYEKCWQVSLHFPRTNH